MPNNVDGTQQTPEPDETLTAPSAESEVENQGTEVLESEEKTGEDDVKNTEKENGAEPETTPKPAKRESEAEKRIRALVGQRKRAEEEANYYKGLLEQQKNIQEPVQTKNNDVFTGEPKLDNFSNWDDYQAARDNFLIEKAKIDFRKELELQTQTQKIEIAKKSFNQKLNSMLETDPIKFEKIYSLQVRNDIINEIVSTDSGLEVAEYLAENPKELMELNQLSGPMLYKKIGKIEALLQVPIEQRQTKKISTAPTPIVPNTTTKGTARKSIEDMSQEEFIAYRNKQDFEKRYGKSSR